MIVLAVLLFGFHTIQNLATHKFGLFTNHVLNVANALNVAIVTVDIVEHNCSKFVLTVEKKSRR